MRKFLLATMAILWLLTGFGGRLVAQENIAVWKFPATGGATTSINADCVSDLIQSSDCELTVLTEGWTVIAYDSNKDNFELCGTTDGTKGLRMINSNGDFETASIVFKISTAPFSNIRLSYDHRIAAGSAGGYATETWAYSTNGSTFTDMTPIEGGTTTWAGVDVDFSSISALNGKSSVWFKLTVSGAAASGAATIIDNVVFSGSPLTCVAPVNLAAVADEAPTQAIVSWDPAGTNEESYTIVYETGTMNETVLNYYVENNYANVFANATSPYTVTGLAPNTTYYIYIRANCGGDDNSLWTSTTVHTNNLCAISGLEVSAITESTASLSWTTEADNTMIRVFTAATADPWETTENLVFDQTVSGTSYDLTGLSSFTSYYVYAKAVCSVNNISEPISANFATELGGDVEVVTIGSGTSTNSYLPTYCYYNYSLTEQIYTPDEIGDGGTIARVAFYCTAGVTRSFDIYMLNTSKESFSSATDWVAVTAGNRVFSGNVTFTAGAWTTIDLTTPFMYDGASNLLIAVDDNTGSYVSGVNWQVFNATSKAIRVYSDGTNYDPASPTSYSGTVLNVKNQLQLSIIPLPTTCPKPTNLAATGIRATSATITWEAGGEETTWMLKWGAAGFDVETAGTAVSIETTPSYNLTGLMATTGYDVYVKAVCAVDDESAWKKVSFTTPCATVGVPYSQTFENITGSYAIPDCWERVASYTSGSSVYPYVYTDANGYGYTHNGQKCLYMYTYSYYSAPENIIALSPMENINTLQVSLWARASSTIPQAFEIGYMKNGEFTSVKSITLTTAYQQFIAYMSEVPADAEKIAIRSYHSSSSVVVYVDDIEVDVLPNCVEPQDIVISDVTTNSASVSWTDVVPAAAWQYQLDNNEITTVQAKPIELTGLAANTEYMIKVRSACGDDYSEWSRMTFRTSCDAVANFPWTEDFESVTAPEMPSCWTVVDVNNDGDYWKTFTDYGNPGNSVGLYTDFNNGNNNDYLILPAFELNGSYVFSYDVRARSTSEPNDYRVVLSTTGFSPENFNVVLKDLETVNYTTYQTKEIRLNDYNGTVYIAIHVPEDGLDGYYIYFDNFSIREQSADNTILSYAASTEQGDAICNLDHEAHSISVVLRSGYVAGAAISQTIVLNDERATIEQQVGTEFVDLPASFAWYRTSADTTITYKVTAENGDELIYTANVSVESCAAPSALVSEQTSITNVNLSWTPAEGTTSWNFFCTNTHLTASELAAVSEYSTVNTASVSYAVTGENTYYWYVRADCGGSYSAWVEGSFTSWENCVPPTNLTTTVENDNNIVVSWNVQSNLPVAETNISDDFERGTIEGCPFTFTNDATYPWVITTAATNGGTYSIKSGNYNIASSTSVIEFTVNYPSDGTVSFYGRVSSEQTSVSSDYDYGTFYIDDVQQGTRIINSTSFSHFTYNVTAGEHILKWRYKKDGSVNSNDDCFYVDDITVFCIAPTSSVVIYKNDAELATLPAATTSYTDEGLEAGNYCYKVKTICREGSESEFSTPVCQEINSCIAVTNISASNILDVSATISWTRGSNETAWNVKVNDATPIAITEATAGVTVNDNVISYVLTGLEPTTHYTVAIQTNCAGTLGQMWPDVEFTTERTPATLPYTCDFEDATENNAWILENGTQANKWNIGTAANNGGDNGLYISNDSGASNVYTVTSLSYVYAYRPIYVSASSDYTISFDWKANGDGNYDLLRAFLVPTSISLTAGNANGMTAATNTTPARWIDVANPQGKLNLATEWQHSEKTMSIEPGMYNIVFFWKNNASSGNQAPAAVDNLSIVEISCPTVANIEAENITTNSADITWTERGTATAWDVVFSATDLTDEQLAGATPELVNAASYQATELTANTPYYMYVRAHCSAEDQSEWVAMQFRTICGAMSVPFTETFTDYTATAYSTAGVMPDCWSYIYNGTSAAYAPHVSNSTTYAPMSGAHVNYLFVIASPSTESYGNNNILIMPTIEGGYANRNVSFIAKTSATSNSVLHFGYMNGNDFVNLSDTTFSTTTKTFSYIVPNSVPAGADFAIKFTASSSTVYFGIDSVHVRETSADNTILSYAASTAQGDAICNVDNNAHTISVELRAGATAPVVIGQTIVLSDANATIKQQVGDDYVTPPNYFGWFMTTTDTTITYKVRAENGAEQLYTATITVESCPAPSALVSEQTSSTNVNCSWTAAEGTTAWNFYCSATQLTLADLDALTASDYTTVNTASISATVVGETTYYWYVRTDCDGSYSAWLESSFSTWENCVPPTNLTTTVENDNNIVVSWDVQDNLPLGPGIFTDDFERDAVNGGQFQYTNDATYPWVITTSAVHGGAHSIKSGNAGVSNSTSSIEITTNYSSDGTISFYGRVSSEQTSTSNDWDNGRFYIDNVQQGNLIINSTTFSLFTYNVAAGSHTFKWEYKKDGSVNSNDDCFYVDDITMQGLVPGGNSSVVLYKNDAELITLPALTTSYTDEGLAAGNYCYKVKTVCREGSESEFSEPVCQEINSCLSVTNLSASEITTNSATLSWTRGTDETAWNMTVNGGSQVALTETSEGVTVNANVITYALTGLESITDYTVTIQSDCGGSVSQSVATINFTTERIPATLPYTCGFEATDDNRQWVLENGTQTNKWYVGTAASNNSENGLYISNTNGATNAHAAAISYVYAYRTINVDHSSEYTISFDWKAQGYSTYDLLRAFLVPASATTLAAGNANGMTATTNTTPTGWIDVANPAGKLNLQTTWQHSEKTMEMEAGMYNLVFFWKNNTYSNSSAQPPAAVDNVSVVEVSCPSVANIVASPENITDNSAEIAWTERGNANAWEIVVSETTIADLASATPTSVTVNPYTVTGLDPETTYHVYVRATCAVDDNSQWAHATFTTVASCPVPDGLVASAITGNSATITWNGYTASNWTLEHRLGTTGDWTVVPDLDAATYTITGLEGQTTYNVRVKAVCDVDEESAYSSILSFATTCPAVTLPWNEDFEDGIDCWTLVDEDGDGYEWFEFYLPEDENTAENLLSAHTGSYMMQSESWNSAADALTPNNWLISPAIDLTSESGTVKLSFFIGGHQSEWPSEHYKVCVSNSPIVSSFTTILDEDTIQEAGWHERNVDLSAYIGQVIYLAFVHFDCTDMFRLDLDDISVYVDNSTDAAITEITAPTHGNYSTCAFTDAEQIKIKILNNGGSAISDFDVSYTINGGTTVTETVTTSVAPAEIYEYIFAQTADLSEVGEYTITARVNLTGDETDSNNSASKTITSGDAVIRIHALTDSGSGQSWSVTNTLTNEVVAETTTGWQWNVEVNNYICVDASQCYSVAVNDDNGMSSPAYLEILYNGVQVAGSTEPGSFTGPSLVAERFAPNCQSSENDIITFSVPDMINVDINNANHTVTAEISFASTEELTAIVPTITVSDYAEITLVGDAAYVEGAAQDFTNPVVYTVVAENGTPQEWTVTVTRSTVASSEKDIISFTFPGQVGESVIDATEHTVTAYASWNISLEDPVAPTIEVSPMATISPESGVAQIFSSPVTYVVTAEDRSTQEWIVTITQDSSSLASLPYTCDFEDATENSNWVLENGTQNNAWYIGSAANNGGATGLYISDDDGDSNNYSGSASFVYAYRQINIPETGHYDISFDWLANGESNYDLLRAFAVPTTLGSTLVAGNNNGMSSYYNTEPTGWIDIANPTGKLNLEEDEWQTSAATVSLEAGAYNLVFFWKNDGSVYHQTPAAVDNISIARTTYTITASAEGFGSIAPAGDTIVDDGATVVFTMTPIAGFALSSLMVDGVERLSQVENNTYTFENVSANHTIVASFGAAHIITATAGDGGSIDPAGEVSVGNHGNMTFTITAAAGKIISSVLVDNVDTLPNDGAIRTTYSFTFTDVTTDHTIAATFVSADPHTITARAGEGGSITPSGEVTVLYNDSQTFEITANEGYRLSRVYVDTTLDVTALLQNNAYTFTNVIADHTIDATFVVNTYTLTIHYVYADNTTAADDYSATLNYGAEYSVASPEIAGYTADIDTVAGTMPAQDVEITVTYNANSYNLTIHYVNAADNSPVAEDYTAQVAFGDTYSVASPDVIGYTTEQLTVEGIMPAEDVELTVTYNVNSYTLTIHYVYADTNDEAAPDYIETVVYNTAYSVASPVIDGYTADQTTVAGTMPAEDVTVTVTYTESVPETYTLTIHYVYADNTTAAADYTATLEAGETYSVASPVIDGYTADQLIVAGTMPAEDVTVTVTYTANPVDTYTLTIHYVYAETNATAAPDHTETLAEGANYSVASPVIDGYTASQTTVAGTMPAQNVEVTVTYTANPVDTYTLTIHYVFADDNSTAAPDHTETLAAGANYSVASPVIDGYTADQTTVAGTMPAQNVEVTVRYTANSSTTYTIIATNGNNGTISPSGVVYVAEGANKTFTITPNAGYRIATVMVDGVSAIDDVVDFQYTFYNVTADHNINVTFTNGDAVDEYTAGSMSVYPNPNNGMFSIDFANINGDATYQLIDARGALVETRDINVMDGDTMNFNYDLRPGTYFVRIITTDKVYVDQIVVE